MRKKSRLRFIPLLSLFAILACRTSACQGSDYLSIADGGLILCHGYVSLDSSGASSGYACNIQCPNYPGTYAFDYPGGASNALSAMTYAEVQAQYCPGQASAPQPATLAKTASPTTFSAAGQTITYTYVIANPTGGADLSGISIQDDMTTVSCPGATLVPGASMTCSSSYVTTAADVSAGSVTNTAQLTTTAPGGTGPKASSTVTLAQAQQSAPALTTSVLTGEVLTLCDPVNRPVNLRLVDGTDTNLVTQELANGNLHILIAGQDISSTCAINPSNTTLLTCTYPSGLTTLPVEGQVVYNANVIQTFKFDGENGCTPPPSTGGGGGSDTNEPQPQSCDPHTDDSCPLDCTDPANADIC
jgi:uncharacterized repeat protein (TIGR01451 family)